MRETWATVGRREVREGERKRENAGTGMGFMDS